MSGRASTAGLVLSVSALAASVVLVAGFAVERIVRQEQRRAVELALNERRELFDDLVASRITIIDAALQQVARLLEQAPERARDLAAGNVDPALAAEWADAVGLDHLDLLGPGGRVLSSASWAEQAGLVSPDLAVLPPAAAGWHLLQLPRGTSLALVGTRPVDHLDVVLGLVGGLDPTVALLDEVARGQAVELVAPGAPPGAGRVIDRSEPAWATTEVELIDIGGGLAGRLVIAVDRSADRRLLARLRGTLAAAGLLVVLAAALSTWLVGRRTGRTMDDLVGAIERVAAGDADYDSLAAPGDRSAELAATFSRLHRALELERRRARAADRVAAWREVARRVAHEVKNPLAPIRLTVENLRRARRQAPDRFDELFDDGAETILEEVDRLRRLIGEFSDYARLPLPRRRATAVAPVVDRVVALWDGKDGTVIDCRIAAGLPAIEIDADQVGQALHNVIGNAVEAARETVGEPTVSIRVEQEQRMLRIEVCDNGPGFGTEALEHLFEPYFTSRPEGTGLGLAITHRIVTEHGGVIEAANVPGGGGQVTVRLPLPARPEGTA